MNVNKRPLKKSILLGFAITFFILCVVLTVTNYLNYSGMLYVQYKDHIKNVISSTVCDIDVDDLEECIATGVESPKYHELQEGLDKRKDNTDVHFIYIIIPLNTNDTDNIQNVIAAVSSEEYEENPEYPVKLNSLTGDSYSPSVAQKYLDAYHRDELSYFENTTERGNDLTGLQPLYDSEGNRVAALCVDIDAHEIHNLLLKHSLITVAITLIAGVISALLFLLWANRNVVKPIEELEKSVSDYMANGLNSQDPDSLIFAMPEINCKNEVESLAHKIVLMSEALKVTVSNMLNTEQQLVHMSIIAHKDSLTQVGNKAAYKDYVKDLQKEINSGDAEFAVVMADVNRLKQINDSYGHEKGDIYIKRCCKIICDTYQHSPVFRVGGDEFVVILRDRDYERRDELLKKARSEFDRATAGDPDKPWKNCSMAVGMAVFDKSKDKNTQAVLSRADKKMYESKNAMHKKSRKGAKRT